MLAVFSASCPACTVPASLIQLAPALSAVTDKMPGVTMDAPLVLTLPCVARRAMFEALLWLLATSTVAPCMLKLPAATLLPWAARPRDAVIAFGAQAAVGLDACAQGAGGVALHAAGVDVEVARGADAAAVLHHAAG